MFHTSNQSWNQPTGKCCAIFSSSDPSNSLPYCPDSPSKLRHLSINHVPSNNTIRTLPCWIIANMSSVMVAAIWQIMVRYSCPGHQRKIRMGVDYSVTGAQRNGCTGLRAFHSSAVEMKNEEAWDLVLQWGMWYCWLYLLSCPLDGICWMKSSVELATSPKCIAWEWPRRRTFLLSKRFCQHRSSMIPVVLVVRSLRGMLHTAALHLKFSRSLVYYVRL